MKPEIYNFIISFFGMLLGSGGFLRYMLVRHDKKVETNRLIQESNEASFRKVHEKKLTKLDKQLDHLNLILEHDINMTCALTQYRVTKQVDKFLNIGMITLKDKSIIKEMYEPYAKLGRNHYAKDAIEALEQVPIVSEYPDNIRRLLIK